MIRQFYRIFSILAVTFFLAHAITAQGVRQRRSVNLCDPQAGLNGLYRIDPDDSDRLYSVIEGAASRVPYGDQQQFFMDLAIRLTPPDLLAIECRGRNVSLGSSRAARVNFLADGQLRSAKTADGQTTRSRIAFERGSLVFTSTGGDDNLIFSFTPFENGNKLRVIRRLTSRELIEPIVINTVYRKINQVARWDVFEDATTAQINENNPPEQTSDPNTRRTPKIDNTTAETLQQLLDEWIAATNRRDLDFQMKFYAPQLKAFYLTRNVARSAVRAEKTRVFAAAKSVDIRAAEPEIIFQDNNRTAIMRFRKQYSVANRQTTRSGEVVQELRWQLTRDGWKIFSERDIRVIR